MRLCYPRLFHLIREEGIVDTDEVAMVPAIYRGVQSGNLGGMKAGSYAGIYTLMFGDRHGFDGWTCGLSRVS